MTVESVGAPYHQQHSVCCPSGHLCYVMLRGWLLNVERVVARHMTTFDKRWKGTESCG